MAPPITQSSTPSLLPNTSQFSFRSTSTLSLESAFEVERRRKEGEGFNQLRTALPPSHLSQTEGGRVYEGIGWEKSEVGSEGGWESKGTRMSVRRGDWKTYSENIKVRLRVSRGAIGGYGRDREEWNIVGKTLWVTKVSTRLVFFGSRLMEWGQEGETVLEMDQEAYIDAVLGAKYERTTLWSRLFGCRPDSSDRARSHTPFLMVSEAPPLICIVLNHAGSGRHTSINSVFLPRPSSLHPLDVSVTSSQPFDLNLSKREDS
jgi:hypothetical protein